MHSGIRAFILRRFPDAPTGWLLLFVVAVIAGSGGYAIGSAFGSPIAPGFEFTNATSTIQASGAWKVAGSKVPNATGIFCWFPSNGCQLIVAELIREGIHSRFKIVEKSLDIIQLSDIKLTATASSTDPCHIETLRIDRKARAATLSVGPAKPTTCAGVQTMTASLGE